MCFKTILVPIGQHDLAKSTLKTALRVAQEFDSYIEGFALQGAIRTTFAVSEAGAVPIPALEQEIAKTEKQRRGLFENFMQEHGVPRAGDTKVLSSGWLDNAPEDDHFVGSYGRVFDVIVLSKPGRDPRGPRMTTLEAGLFESGRPVLIAPPSPQPQMGTNILMAWNGSTEQATLNYRYSWHTDCCSQRLEMPNRNGFIPDSRRRFSSECTRQPFSLCAARGGQH